MTPLQIKRAIDDLCERYMWRLTPREQRALVRAIGDHDRVVLSTVSGRAYTHRWNQDQPFAPRDLIAALDARSKGPVSEPDRGRIPARRRDEALKAIAAIRKKYWPGGKEQT